MQAITVAQALVTLEDNNYDKWRPDIRGALCSIGALSIVDGKETMPVKEDIDRVKSFLDCSNQAAGMIIRSFLLKQIKHCYMLKTQSQQ